ncbi:hypothetical protein SAMN05192573_107120 [Mucilaginibacter gossypii]|uniref:Uncharacterized protein n=1 Tax=Mucilaginibacter gossypii TaxID=551996 RepID=A0A1G8A7X8_9SPHI|nr:hypothetical protein SAMN05192573_107120 [Mucilaginibacter gossypii]
MRRSNFSGILNISPIFLCHLFLFGITNFSFSSAVLIEEFQLLINSTLPQKGN